MPSTGLAEGFLAYGMLVPVWVPAAHGLHAATERDLLLSDAAPHDVPAAFCEAENPVTCQAAWRGGTRE